MDVPDISAAVFSLTHSSGPASQTFRIVHSNQGPGAMELLGQTREAGVQSAQNAIVPVVVAFLSMLIFYRFLP